MIEIVHHNAIIFHPSKKFSTPSPTLIFNFPSGFRKWHFQAKKQMASYSCLLSTKTTSTISFKTTIIIFLQFQLWFWGELWMGALSARGSVCQPQWWSVTLVACVCDGRRGDGDARSGAGANGIVMLTGPIEVKPFIFETWIKPGRCCWFQKGEALEVMLFKCRTTDHSRQLPSHDVWSHKYKRWRQADGPVMPIEWACLLRAMFDSIIHSHT